MVSRETLIIRPGLIVGPGDETDRFSYWPVRIDRGGEVLPPEIRVIPCNSSMRETLAEWTIRMAEQGETGIYNDWSSIATWRWRNAQRHQVGIKLESDIYLGKYRFSKKQKVEPWSDMPVWVPPVGEAAGMGRISIKRAARERSDVSSARRDCARYIEVVQISISRTTSQTKSRHYARARSRSSRCLAQTTVIR